VVDRTAHRTYAVDKFSAMSDYSLLWLLNTLLRPGVIDWEQFWLSVFKESAGLPQRSWYYQVMVQRPSRNLGGVPRINN
jgi:hypothetical protein